MNHQLKKRMKWSVLLLVVAISFCSVFQVIYVYLYNSQSHIVTGHDTSSEVQMNVYFRGDATSRWYKLDMDIYGNIWDAALTNPTDDEVRDWSLVININDDCYLNQFWNGEVEIHQRGTDGQMQISTLDLAKYDPDDLSIDYLIAGADLLIPLHAGDQIIYHPSVSLYETPVNPNSEVVVGLILYYEDDFDLSDYYVEYTYHRLFTHGTFFILDCVLIVILILLLGLFFISDLIYRRAAKEMELRVSGISCMSEIYALIYIIDIDQQTLTPVGVPEEFDRPRPKDIPANDQMHNFVRVDVEEEYAQLAHEFIELATLSERMKERNSIVFEYVSHAFGWSRMQYISMERRPGKPLNKVLFTIQQINDEKEELDKVVEQVELVKSENRAKSAFLANMSSEIRIPLDAMIENNEKILRVTKEDQVRGYANEIRSSGSILRMMFFAVLDFARLEAGKIELKPEQYYLSEQIRDLKRIIHGNSYFRNVDLQIDVTESLPDCLYGDGDRIKQVMMHLVLQAIAETGLQCIRLAVFGKPVDSRNVHLLISVKAVAEDPANASADRIRWNEEQAGITVNPEPASVIGNSLVTGLLKLLHSELKTVETIGQGRDYYFELDQQVRDTTPIGKIDWNEVEN